MRLVPVKVTATSPLTITTPDGASLKGLGVVGLAYSTSGTYVAAMQEGAIPLVLPVGTTTGTDTVIDGNA